MRSDDRHSAADCLRRECYIAGAAASKTDKAIDPAMNHDFSALKPYAQFPVKEPEYLSAIK